MPLSKNQNSVPMRPFVFAQYRDWTHGVYGEIGKTSCSAFIAC